ncbi:ZIP family metal transporter (plasmid) [Arthrobacter sp. FW305-BF8]|uniref:ZIP family metal transporter n=1 Tax=Arthrobacter sp. FW305-BF8 TaxID=2879617 RepID=UPI001F178D9C|nr:ZIP family metal transporter [Arthrobacter sp. FW305-BF8]UKA56717.1 ZIP family metal transporter [Arthrobacter sp. FW305-BF8]
MNLVTQSLLLVGFPVAAAVLGSIVAAFRPPGLKLSSAIQHFAAGVVLAALAGEVLPDLRAEGNLGFATAGFAGGTAVMLTLGALGRKIDRASPVTGSLPAGLLVAVGIDLLLDGLLVGLGTVLGARQALILTIALTIEILFLALSLTVGLKGRGLSGVRAGSISSALGLLTAVGAVGGAFFLGGASGEVLALVLAFGAATLLYLTVEELLTEAHEQEETVLLGATFFLGFLVIYVLGAL